MNQLFLLFFILFSFVNSTHAEFREADKSYIPFNSVIFNGGAEQGKSGWTASAGTFAIETSTPLRGNGSFSWDASANAQTLTSGQFTVPEGLKGLTCSAVIVYKGGDSNLTFKVIDGSLADVATVAVATSTNATLLPIHFTCPTSGTFALRLIASANAAIIYFDEAYLGRSGFAPIVDSLVSSTAAIARSKLASGSNDHVLINSGAGAMSSEATLSPVRGGTGVANNSAATLTRSGNHALTLTTTNTTGVTLPTTGTLSTLAGTESLSNKTVVTGIFDDALDLNYETTPSNPAASKVRLYVKSDNKLYKLTSAGVETEVGGTSPSTATDTATGLVTSYAPIVNSAPHAVANASYVGTQTDGYSTHFYSTGNTDRTFTTPAVALSFGREITLVKTDTGTGNVSVALTDGSLIGATNASTLYAQGASTVLRCDGSSWHVVVAAVSTSTIASTFTWNGSGSTSGSITIRFRRIGDWITLFVPDVSPNTGTGSTVLSGNTALPVWARPAANTNRMPLAVTNNGATTTTFGALTVSTGGVLQIVRDPAATAFTNSASAGVAFLATLTYYVGTGS